MRPILFDVFSLPIYSYHFAAFLGSMLVISTTSCEIRRLGLDPRRIYALMFWLFVSGLAGARVMHGLMHWQLYAQHPYHLLVFWRGGMALYGTVLFSAPLFVWYVKHYRLAGGTVADAFAPGLALFIAALRVGCFLAGCCFGKVCSADFSLAVRFPNPVGELPAGTPVHPFQLYAAGSALFLFLILWFWRKRKRFDGELALFFMIYYPFSRFLLDFFRGDERIIISIADYAAPLFQMIGFPLAVISLLVLLRKRRQNKQSSGP